MLGDTAPPVMVRKPASAAQGQRKTVRIQALQEYDIEESILIVYLFRKAMASRKGSLSIKGGQTSYAKRTHERKALAAMKAKKGDEGRKGS
jgi:hypothetical protein